MDRNIKKYPANKPFRNTLIEMIGPDVWRIVLKYVAFNSLVIPIALVNAIPIHNMGCKNKSLCDIDKSCISYHKSLQINEMYYCKECNNRAHCYIKCQGSICCYCDYCIDNDLIECNQCINRIIYLKKTPPHNIIQAKIWATKTIVELISENNYGDHLTFNREHNNCILCLNELPDIPTDEFNEYCEKHYASYGYFGDISLAKCVNCNCEHNVQRKDFRIDDDENIDCYELDGPNNPTFLSVGLHWVGRCIKRFYICQFCIKEPKLTPMLDKSITMILGKLF